MVYCNITDNGEMILKMSMVNLVVIVYYLLRFEALNDTFAVQFFIRATCLH